MGSSPPGGGSRRLGCSGMFLGVHHSKNLLCHARKLVEIKDFYPAWSLHDVWYCWPFLYHLPALSLTSAGPRYLPILRSHASPQGPACHYNSVLVLSKEVWHKSFNQKTQFCHDLNIWRGHINRSYISDAQNFEAICFHFLIFFQRCQSTLIRQELLITTFWFCFHFVLNFYSLGSL